MASSNQHRVYIASNARANHYLLVEFKPSDEFYLQFNDYINCYNRIARELFSFCDEYELHNVQILANDKLPVVRYHDEPYCLQTPKQMLFFYNPKYHESHTLYADSNNRCDKIRFLFLATGDDLRSNAAHFHSRVQKAISSLQEHLLSGEAQLKIRDHQHLTYDLFAKAKGNKESYGYKLRSIYPRYQSRHCQLPEQYNDMTYVTFSIPVTREIKTQFQAMLNDKHYDKFYCYLFDAFQRACINRDITRGAMIADGSRPIVRNSMIDKVASNSELHKLTFNCDNQAVQMEYAWQGDKLVDMVHFVIAAGKIDEHDMGFGKFMNNVHSAINEVTDELAFNPTRQELLVRFFQHINYQY